MILDLQRIPEETQESPRYLQKYSERLLLSNVLLNPVPYFIAKW
jgi:hypothetical protein